jgi:peptide deformylase
LKYDVLVYGAPPLRQKAVPVEQIDQAIRDLARDMLHAMYGHRGLGLAAEQVGRREAICVIDVSPRQDADPQTGQRVNPGVRMPLVLVNPKIVGTAGVQVGEEGCLSFPEVFVTVRRAAEVSVAFRNLDGAEQTVLARGLLARVVQHELDHLDGTLLVDRMSPVQKVAVAGKLKRLRKTGQAAAA